MPKSKTETEPEPVAMGDVHHYVKVTKKISEEVSKLVVGQADTIDSLVRGLLCDGHVLVEGIPGIAKTVTIRALAMASGCKFGRVQFTVDLLPTDIIGMTTYNPKKGFYTIKGPIFANFLLADEINRAPPKTQSAMLEAMQEKQVSIGKTDFQLERPFFVMATQNPIERGGTFPLPEAQLDRFLFKLYMGYPQDDDEMQLFRKNITLHEMSEFDIMAVTSPQEIIEMQQAVKSVYVDESIQKYMLNLVKASRYPDKYGVHSGKYLEWGGSPRASLGLFIAAKAMALMSGRNFVDPEDVREIASDVLNHRLILNYEGQAEEIKIQEIIAEILERVPLP